MDKRQQIKDKIQEKRSQIEQIGSEIKELILEDIQLCDEKQWYTEMNEEHVVSRKPKKVETFLIGRVNFKEEFKDEDTKESIFIDRSRVARVNGEWQW